MMKIKLLTVLLFLSRSIIAGSVSISIDPETPIKNEVFDIRFKVSITSNDKPNISFSPIGLEILERISEPEYHFEIRGGSGRAQTTKTLTYTYKAVATRGGSSFLKNIVVEVGSEKIKHKNINISILSQRKEMPKVFARAEVSSDSVYLGEGIDVRYYVYSLYPVVQTEVKSFPKLNGFIKRFHKPVDTEQAVRLDGKVYRRSLRYSARVYPEKTGTLSIDPLRLIVQYSAGSSNPFGSMGFGFNRFKRKNLNSKTLKVDVKPLPVEGLLPSFTGLVGEHEFKLIMNKNKYLVNEAVEARLEVSGPGALEKLDAPRLFESEALEKFDDKSNFQEVSEDSGRKIFEYTFLARANANIKERTLELAYFSPEEKAYKVKKILIPELIIGGISANSGVAIKDVDSKAGNLGGDRVFRPLPAREMINAPLFDQNWRSIGVNWVKYVYGFLFLVIITQLLESFYSRYKQRSNNDEVNSLYRTLERGDADYQSMLSMLYMLRADNSIEADIVKVIDKSSLSEKNKLYFKKTISGLESNSFSLAKNNSKVKIKHSALRSLKKEIENVRLRDLEDEKKDESIEFDSRST